MSRAGGKWARRAVTIPLVTLAFLASSAVSPLFVGGALAVDLTRWLVGRRPFVTLRLLAFLWLYLAAEVVGLAALFWIWAVPGRRRLVDATFAVQQRWASALFRAVRRLFGLDFQVAGEAQLEPGPYLVFIRHASVIDTLLPTVFVTARHGIRLRFVLKRELLLDPCLDVAGLRLPNCFVRRTGEDGEDVAAVGALARDLGPRDGVLIYPEGTRFSPDKRRRALDRLATTAPELLAHAKLLTRVMPPRLGGPLALLDAAPDADVVFIAHAGLDGFAHVRDVFTQALARRSVALEIWRVPRASIPTSRAERIRWLYEQWQKVDRFVAEHAKA